MSRWASAFRRADRLLQQIGPRCPRLEGVWQALWADIVHDPKLLAWFNKRYPEQAGPKQARKVRPSPPPRKVKTPVDRAIKVLQSYGKRK